MSRAIRGCRGNDRRAIRGSIDGPPPPGHPWMAWVHRWPRTHPSLSYKVDIQDNRPFLRLLKSFPIPCRPNTRSAQYSSAPHHSHGGSTGSSGSTSSSGNTGDNTGNRPTPVPRLSAEVFKRQKDAAECTQRGGDNSARHCRHRVRHAPGPIQAWPRSQPPSKKQDPSITAIRTERGQ